MTNSNQPIQQKRPVEQSEVHFRSALEDLRNRTLWKLYQTQYWLKLFSRVLAVSTILIILLMPLADKALALAWWFPYAMAVLLGFCLALRLSSYIIKRVGKKIESRKGEFNPNIPQWVTGSFDDPTRLKRSKRDNIKGL